jgi:hypothetical protein
MPIKFQKNTINLNDIYSLFLYAFAHIQLAFQEQFVDPF